jgi:lysine-specific histone demethylase 1
MNQLEMTVINKIFLVFPKIFWPFQKNMFGSLGKADDDILFINMYVETQLPCLHIKLKGGIAVELEREEDSKVINIIMTRLSEMFPEAYPIPYPIETIITRWSHDKYSCGSFVQLKESGDPHSFRALMGDSRRLFLSGEYASDTCPGTVQGNI